MLQNDAVRLRPMGAAGPRGRTDIDLAQLRFGLPEHLPQHVDRFTARRGGDGVVEMPDMRPKRVDLVHPSLP